MRRPNGALIRRVDNGCSPDPEAQRLILRGFIYSGSCQNLNVMTSDKFHLWSAVA